MKKSQASFLIALLTAVCMVGLAEWHFHQANTRQSRRRQELVACYRQSVRETMDSVEARDARSISWYEPDTVLVAYGADGKKAVFTCSTIFAPPGENEMLCDQLRSLAGSRYRSLLGWGCNLDRLSALWAGNACTPWQLGMFYHLGGPAVYGNFILRSADPQRELSFREAGLAPFAQSGVTLFRHTPGTSLSFCYPKATGGLLEVPLLGGHP